LWHGLGIQKYKLHILVQSGNRTEADVVNKFAAYIRNETGIAAIEYAVIGSFMGLALIPLLPVISQAIESRLAELAEYF
jgi:Flp pilus assembly pilin Flp